MGGEGAICRGELDSGRVTSAGQPKTEVPKSHQKSGKRIPFATKHVPPPPAGRPAALPGAGEEGPPPDDF